MDECGFIYVSVSTLVLKITSFMAVEIFFTFSMDKFVKGNLIVELCSFVPDSELLCSRMSRILYWFCPSFVFFLITKIVFRI